MGKVGDQRPLHLGVSLDGRAAEPGMCRGAGIGRGEASQPGYVARQFDDLFVVNVVQHKLRGSGSPAYRPWRAPAPLLYMVGRAGNTVRPIWPCRSEFW